jgi:proline iminopeptidase
MESRRIPPDDGMTLHVGVTGTGVDVVTLSGGPGCVQYLEHDSIAPRGVSAWYPEPRGVGRSQGSAHDLRRVVDDLESLRRSIGIEA